MGSEQSSHNDSKGKRKNTKRSQSASSGRTYSEPAHTSSNQSSSPRPSICSDSDIPYISYAANRSASEDQPSTGSDKKFRWMDNSSTKLRENKTISREIRDAKAKSVGSIVTVKTASEAPSIESDQMIRRLLEIPRFTPIIRGNIKIPWAKDSEITEKIDPIPLIRTSHLLEDKLACHAEAISTRQKYLMERVIESESTLDSIMKAYVERQKRFAKLTEKINKVSEISHSLNKCHCILNETLSSIEVLNNALPSDYRLEPFVWTTG